VEILENCVDNRIYAIPDNKMEKLQRVLGGSFSYMRSQFALVVYGNNGKPTIYEKVLRRVVIDTLGKVKDTVNTLLILDDDGIGHSELEEKVSSNLESLSRDRSKFSNLPIFNKNNELFILTHPKTQGNLKIILRTVPECLELQIAKKAIEMKCPTKKNLLESGPDKAIDLIASIYYNGNEELLIRESASWLKDEPWVRDILEVLNT
jgi:hypothetical protein